MRLMSTHGRLPAHILCLSSFQSLHSRRIWRTVCGPSPHWHWSVSTLLMAWRYARRLILPVRICVITELIALCVSLCSLSVFFPGRTPSLKSSLPCLQVQNCIANLRINYNTSRASNLPTTLSHRPGKSIAPKGSLLAACFERKAQEQNLPLRPLSCLLLKPVSTRSPLPRSAYRPTHVSVLSSHIEGVISCHQAIASIICYAL
jgi:hypothetical protein